MAKHEARRLGQVTVEMAVLITVAVVGFVIMAIYLQRAVHGTIRSNADSIGSQFSAYEPWTENTNSAQNSNETANNTVSNQSQDTSYSQTLK